MITAAGTAGTAFVTTFSSELRTQRAALETEVGRLEELLSANPDWRTLRALESGMAAGLYREAEREAMNTKRAHLHRILSENRVYSAYIRLREAVELMREEEAQSTEQPAAPISNEATFGDQSGTASREAFKTRVNVKIHATPPLPNAQHQHHDLDHKPDDLTAIRGIDAKLQEQLNGLGVRSWSQISNWRRADVQTFGAALGLNGQINRENWIEQAAALTIQNERQSGDQKSKVDEDIAAASRAILASVQPAAIDKLPDQSVDDHPIDAATNPAAVASETDDLTLIKGICPETEERLHQAGVSSFTQIADWKVDDIAQLSVAQALGGRIGREGWVEQAGMLAQGRITSFAARRAPKPEDVLPETSFVRTHAVDQRVRTELLACAARLAPKQIADASLETSSVLPPMDPQPEQGAVEDTVIVSPLPAPLETELFAAQATQVSSTDRRTITPPDNDRTEHRVDAQAAANHSNDHTEINAEAQSAPPIDTKAGIENEPIGSAASSPAFAAQGESNSFDLAAEDILNQSMITEAAVEITPMAKGQVTLEGDGQHPAPRSFQPKFKRRPRVKTRSESAPVHASMSASATERDTSFTFRDGADATPDIDVEEAGVEIIRFSENGDPLPDEGHKQGANESASSVGSVKAHQTKPQSGATRPRFTKFLKRKA
ncbi:MAG: hypothetical protein AAFR75_00710 [Pseudomonadota bacterium]